VQGTRLPDDEWLTRAADGEIKPGDYGRCLIKHPERAGRSSESVYGESWEWFVCCPDGSTTKLWVNEDDRHGHRHYITEHEDGSITVAGSVMGGRVVPVVALFGKGPEGDGPLWHGHLDHGVWRSC
jgi:hypothetical protein